jgi:hypothetical protein
MVLQRPFEPARLIGHYPEIVIDSAYCCDGGKVGRGDVHTSRVPILRGESGANSGGSGCAVPILRRRTRNQRCSAPVGRPTGRGFIVGSTRAHNKESKCFSGDVHIFRFSGTPSGSPVGHSDFPT